MSSLVTNSQFPSSSSFSRSMTYLRTYWQKGVSSGRIISRYSSAPCSARNSASTRQYMAVSAVSFSTGMSLSVSRYWKLFTSSLKGVSLKMTCSAPAWADLAPAPGLVS